MLEEWRGVVGWEELYEVSNLGNVRRKAKGVRTYAGRHLAKCKSDRGYLMAGLYRNGKKTTYKIHQLVAFAFIGERPTGLTINHKDGNKFNNKADNLEYMTRSE